MNLKFLTVFKKWHLFNQRLYKTKKLSKLKENTKFESDSISKSIISSLFIDGMSADE